MRCFGILGILSPNQGVQGSAARRRGRERAHSGANACRTTVSSSAMLCRPSTRPHTPGDGYFVHSFGAGKIKSGGAVAKIGKIPTSNKVTSGWNFLGRSLWINQRASFGGVTRGPCAGAGSGRRRISGAPHTAPPPPPLAGYGRCLRGGMGGIGWR